METLNSRLEQLYTLLAELRVAEASAKNHEILPHFLGLLMAATDSKDHRAVCFVFPDTSRIADTVAMLSSLSWLSREFEDLARLYALRELTPGQRVRIRPTEFVYEYNSVVEATEQYPERVRLKVQGKNEYRTLHIGNALRLEPTTRIITKGQLTTPLSFDASSLDPLNALLRIQTYGNTSMLKNRVLYLTSISGFKQFLSSTECSRANEMADVSTSLAKVVPWGTVNDDGSFSSSDSYQVEGEPLLALSHNVENIAEASLTRDPFSRVVLCDDPRRLIQNLQACDEITESQKLIVTASHNDSEAIQTMKNRDFVIWYISPEDMGLSHGTSDGGRPSFFGKPMTAARNFRDLKLSEVSCRSEFVESAAQNLQKASNDLKDADSDDEAKRCLGRLFNLLFSVSDRCTPLDVDEKMKLRRLLNEVKASISSRSNFISGATMEQITEFCVTFSRLTSSDSREPEVGQTKGKLLLELLQECNGHQKTLVVTRFSENVASVRDLLQQHGIDARVSCDRSLSKDEDFDQIILISWLNSERFGKLVRKYTSPHVSLLGYPFEKVWLDSYKVRLSRERSSNRTGSDEKSAVSGIPEQLFSSPDIPEVPEVECTQIENASSETSIFEIERRILRRRKGTRRPTFSSTDNLESRYVSFAGDFYAYLTESREMPVVTSLITGYERQPGVVPERTVSELETGDFVLFREGSDKDVVQLFAEESIGQEEYAELRKLANVWRRALLARGGDVRQLHRRLQSYGLSKKELTIRSWLHNRSLIGPFSEQDVQIIALAMKDTFSDDPNKVWEAIRRIRNEHRSAGHLITDWLLEELSDRRDLITDGGGKVDLGFGELQIVEVEEIGADLERYPSSRVNRLLRED